MQSKRILPQYNYGAFLENVVFDRGSKRRKDFLNLAVKNARHDNPNVRYYGGIAVQCAGGYGFDRHLRRLVKEGFLKMVAVPYANGWARDLSKPYQLTRSILRPTEKAFAFVDALK